MAKNNPPPAGPPPGQGPAPDAADQFNDEEMEQLKRYGAALGGHTAFSDEVEKHLPVYEAHYKKMRAAAQGGGTEGLGPTEMESQAATQQRVLQAAQMTQGAQQAQQAQAAQVPNQPPPAPSGPAGVTQPYPAQRGQQGPPEVTPMPPSEQEQGQ